MYSLVPIKSLVYYPPQIEMTSHQAETFG